jgi:hypothetical protein
MKALVLNLKLQPLAAKTKGNRVSVEETNTSKANGVTAVNAAGEPIEPPESVQNSETQLVL